jgi:hypothetical protein
MDKLAGSNQPQKTHFLEQLKNLMCNDGFEEYASPSKSTEVNLPLQTISTDSNSNTRATFMAFADAVIPSTLGALDLQLDNYIIWTLDHFVAIEGDWGVKTVPLSSPTARILNIAALQLIISGNTKDSPNFFTYPDGGPFAALSPSDRFEAIRLLENLQVDLEVLPSPYRNNIGLINNIVTSLHQMVMFGYYSEWFSLGSTRLAYPENHRIERDRFVWEKVDYPGPSYGYRAVRGFLVEKFSE